VVCLLRCTSEMEFCVDDDEIGSEELVTSQIMSVNGVNDYSRSNIEEYLTGSFLPRLMLTARLKQFRIGNNPQLIAYFRSAAISKRRPIYWNHIRNGAVTAPQRLILLQ
jgi:hypothetical protein